MCVPNRAEIPLFLESRVIYFGALWVLVDVLAQFREKKSLAKTITRLLEYISTINLVCKCLTHVTIRMRVGSLQYLFCKRV